MKNCTVTFIGGGNMARSLIGGLIANQFPPANIHVVDTNTEVLQSLAAHFAVKTFTDSDIAIAKSNVIILAVKPQQLQQVIKDIRTSVDDTMLVISIAAGIRIEAIERWFAIPTLSIVRAMPNTPSLVQAGATGLLANQSVSHAQHELAESILRSVGLTLWVKDEQQMDAVTALSGSGPAYFFLILEALQAAGQSLGLEQKTAQLLALETAFGAAKMALESGEPPEVLRARVTSPGGTTEQAIKTFEAGHLRELFHDALQAAAHRADELADQLGQNHDV